MKNYAINIGRQFGSGGRDTGRKLAELLGWEFYDKELIRLASRESGLNEELFEKADEQKSKNLFSGWFGMSAPMSGVNFPGFYLSNETLFKIQSDVIRSLALQKSCIFVGRCADYVLKDHPNTLNVFIIADLADRISRVSAIQQSSESKAAECIEKSDKKRRDYYNYFSGKTWGAAESYHLCINSSVLGIDETAEVIAGIARRKFGIMIA